jgi:flagellar biosynthesis GTPase FlhF
MTPQEDPETFTYRGRSLEELVPRIRQDLGDDAVIVSRRETTTGGVGGFFAKREIEVEVRPGQSAPSVAAAFAQQLAQAHERQQQTGQSGGADALRPATSPEVDALPSSSDVTVDDLFPHPAPSQAQGLAALFNAGLSPAAPEPVEPAEPAAPAAPAEAAYVFEDEDEEDFEDDDDVDGDVEPLLEGADDVEAGVAPPPDETLEEPEADVAAELAATEPEPEPETIPEPELVVEPEVVLAAEPEIAAVEQPTGAFDYLGGGLVEPAAEPVTEAVEEPAPEPLAAPEPDLVAPSALQAGLPPAARTAADRMVARGLRPGLAEAIAEEAMAGLAPLIPGADPKDLVTDALARRIPMHPLRRGPGVVGVVGPGGAGKTRCVARLAAAHARHGVMPVAVVALRSPDGGAELRRLLAPYGVALHAVESGAEGAARIATLRGEGLVIVDTPGVSPRSSGELRGLGFELDSLAPDELHLAVPATIGPDAARELVGGVRELGVGALVLTHTDETEMLGTVIGLAIDSGLPLSYLARGQAVEAGLRPASAAELAADLVP